MKSNQLLIFVSLFFLSSGLFAQSTNFVKPTIKYGGVKVEDFAPKFYSLDSNASAVVLADIGSSKFEGNSEGFFSIVYDRFERIRIMNKNGFQHAKVEWQLHRDGNREEKLENFEAVTYNVTDGKLVSTKLDKGSVFKSVVVKGLTEVKFTMPDIKEGSIIDYHYRIVTPFFEYLRSWTFQGDLPKLYSQYEIFVPTLFYYVMEEQGVLKYDLFESKMTSNNYRIMIGSRSTTQASEIVQFRSDVVHNTWGISNVPAYSDEAYTTSRRNYMQRVEFQLNSIKWPDGTVEDRMGNWGTFSKHLLEDENFGKDLKGKNNFASEIDHLIQPGSPKEKAILIYNYLRDNFSCTDHDTYYMDNSLKKVYENKKGNVAEINLLLTSLLNSRGIEAQPVLLSTRENGRVNDLYPLRHKYNYVISRVKIDSNYYLLDASDNTIGFGMLPENTYNGSGRLISETPIIIPIVPDSLKEEKFTSVNIENEENGSSMKGSYLSIYGQYESIGFRNKIKEKSEAGYFSKIEKSYTPEMKIVNPTIDSLKNRGKPVTLKYNFIFKNEGDMIYMNPYFFGVAKNNPFKNQKRLYPIELPYKQKDLYVLNMEIPAGYKVEELPKSEIIKLNEGEGYFEYIIQKDDEKIQMKSKLVINKTTFMAEDYSAIRDFYAFIVKKQNQMVVLKKIK